MTKKQFQFWLEEINREFLNLGAERFIYKKKEADSQAPELIGYKFNTIYGSYVCHPDIPWHIDPSDKRHLKYYMTIFGRFENGKNSVTDNPCGKWNFHYGNEHSEILYVIGAICIRIKNILVDRQAVI